jgi:hypothetical protein
MARPTKRTAAVEAAILTALRSGMTRTAAAESNGVERTQLYRWMARFATFRNAVMAAEAQAEVRATITLRQAGESDWHAALAWLERRRPEDWGRRDRVEITGAIRALVEQAGLGDDVATEAVAYAETFLKGLRRGGA